MQRSLRSLLLLVGFGLGVSLVGCSSDTSPAFSPAEEKARMKEQLSVEMQQLVDMEKQYGMEHSQVQQRKMELGLDPNKPASEQMPN